MACFDTRLIRLQPTGISVLQRGTEVIVSFFSSRRRHTRYWRDWSSDVCSSDLFSITSFATLGIGDVVPADYWRILGGLESLNGFLLIGWSTAYIISASMRLGPFR